MAITVEVSTWAELVSAMTYAAYEAPSGQKWNETTIKLLNDIDLNDTNPEGTTCTITDFLADNIATGYSGRMIIDGGYIDEVTGEEKRHVIKNLRTPITSPSPIFNFSYNLGYYTTTYTVRITLQNLDFQNLILNGATFMNIIENNYCFHDIVLDNCRFTGIRSYVYFINHNNNLTCNRCYFDMPWNGSGDGLLATSLIPKDDSNVTSAVATYCRFKETYNNWQYSEDATTYRPDGANMFSCGYFKMSGCRIEGEMKLPRGYYNDSSYNSHYGLFCKIVSKPIADNYIPATQNVFDVKLSLATNNYQSGDNVLCSSWSGVVRKEAYKYDGTEYDTYEIPLSGAATFGGSITPVVATPSQMKDASYLNGQGFDIIIPSE